MAAYNTQPNYPQPPTGTIHNPPMYQPAPQNGTPFASTPQYGNAPYPTTPQPQTVAFPSQPAQQSPAFPPQAPPAYAMQGSPYQQPLQPQPPLNQSYFPPAPAPQMALAPQDAYRRPSGDVRRVSQDSTRSSRSNHSHRPGSSHSHHSHHSYGPDSQRRSGEHHHHHHHHHGQKTENKRPTLGDSMMAMWDYVTNSMGSSRRT